MRENKKKRWIALLLLMAILVTGCASNGDKGSVVKADDPSDSQKTLVDSETYHYEKTLLNEDKEMVLAQLEDKTILATEQADGSKIWLLLPDGSKQIFDTGLSAPVAKLGSNGRDTILVNFAGETANVVHRYSLDGTVLGTETLEGLTEQASDGMFMMNGNSYLHQSGDELFSISDTGNLKAWNTKTGAVRIIREKVDKVLATVEEVAYITDFEDAKAGVIALDLQTGKEQPAFSEVKGWVTGISKTKQGFVLLDQEWNLIHVDQSGKIISSESLSQGFDELNVGMKMCQAFFLQEGQVYLTVLDFSDTKSFGGQSFTLTKRGGEDPALAGKLSLVIYAKKSEFLFDFFLKQYKMDHPDLRIELISHDELSDDEYLKKINTEILAGKQIDMVFLNGLPVDKLSQKNFFEDLTQWIDAEELKKADAKVIDSVKQDGKLIGLPIDLKTIGFYADKTQENAAIYQVYMDSAQTFDDFKKLAEALIDTGVALFRDLEPEVLLEGLLANNMKDLVDEQGALNAELFKKILAFVEAYSQAPYMNKEMKQDNYDYFGPKGSIALEPLNRASLVELSGVKARFESQDYLILPYPSEAGGYGMAATTVGILKDSKNKAAAANFLQAMALEEELQEKKISMHSIPVRFDVVEKALKNIKSERIISLIQMIQTSFGERELESPQTTWEDGAILLNYFQNSSRSIIGDQKGIHMLVKGSVRYFDGEVGLDELIGSLRNQFLLYANE